MKYFEILHVLRFPINEIKYNIFLIYKICIKFKESITITARIYIQLTEYTYIHNINMYVCIKSYLI